VEVSGWWDKQAEFYSEALCDRMYQIVTQINIRTATVPVQKALLEIFRIAFIRHPHLKSIAVDKVLNVAWE
jgi:hypothetical protein